MSSIFISHSRKDKFFAKKLAEKLAEFDVKAWIDEAEIRVGDSLLDKIASAIHQTDFFAIILSHNSIQSNWVQKELAIAMEKEIGGKKIVVLPILIERCEIPLFLKHKVYADFTNLKDFDLSFSKILDALNLKKTIRSQESSKELLNKSVSLEINTPILEQFDDIKIVGVDRSKTYRPDLKKALFHIYFELSSYPTQEWAQIFEAERQFPRHTMWRHAWLEDKYVVVHCVPDEVKKFHLNDITEDVTNSNRKYREFLKRVAAERNREVQREMGIQEGLDNALDGLDFNSKK